MATQDSVRTAETFYEAFNAHNLDGIERITSESFVGVGPDNPEARKGRSALRRWVNEYIKAFPDCKWSKERFSGQDNVFVMQMTFAGTNTGPMEAGQTIPPTNKTVHVPLAIVGVAREDKIEEVHAYWDMMTLLGQLGIMPPGQ